MKFRGERIWARHNDEPKSTGSELGLSSGAAAIAWPWAGSHLGAVVRSTESECPHRHVAVFKGEERRASSPS